MTGVGNQDALHQINVAFAAREVIEDVQRAVAGAKVYVVGPLRRIDGEVLPCCWNGTAAFKQERTLIKILRKLMMTKFDSDVMVVPLGKAFTRKTGHTTQGLGATSAVSGSRRTESICCRRATPGWPPGCLPG